MTLQSIIGTDKVYALMDKIDAIGIDKAGAEFPKQLGAVVALAQRNPVIFNDFCFKDKRTGYWRSSPFHREWQRMYPEPFSGLYSAIFAPRFHAKTSQVAIGRTLFELGHNPELFVKIVCATDPKAKKRVQELQQNIVQNERLHLVFPDLLPDEPLGWEKHKFFIKRGMVSREPTVESYGILSGATGDRADLLIFDDVCDKRNAVLQPLLRTAVKETFKDVWINLLGPEGTAIYIATPWHLDDLTHELMNDPQWRPWQKPALDEDGNALWPEKWSIEALTTRRNRIGERAFQQQFMLKALSAEDATFTPKAIETSFRRLRYGEWQRGVPVPDDWPIFGGVDLGSSMGTKASYTVMFTIAVSPENVRHPLSVIRGRFKFPQTIEMIVDEYQRFGHNLIYVENNSFQEAVLQQLPETLKGIPVKGHYTGGRKWDDLLGLPGLCATMENEGWVIPKPCRCTHNPCICHQPSCECISCEWKRELQYHPRWKTSDIVMAQWLADTAAVKGTVRKKREFIDLGAIFAEYDREKEEQGK